MVLLILWLDTWLLLLLPMFIWSTTITALHHKVAWLSMHVYFNGERGIRGCHLQMGTKDLTCWNPTCPIPLSTEIYHWQDPQAYEIIDWSWQKSAGSDSFYYIVHSMDAECFSLELWMSAMPWISKVSSLPAWKKCSRLHYCTSKAVGLLVCRAHWSLCAVHHFP